MELNHDFIRQRFQDIQQSLKRLEQLRTLSREAFLQDQDARDIAAYRLLVAIEAAIQLCFHICARRLHQVPEEYAACFALLGEAGMISSELSQRLQRMARFRNVLVHMYWSVDYERVYEVLQRHLEDLRAFVRTIGEIL